MRVDQVSKEATPLKRPAFGILRPVDPHGPDSRPQADTHDRAVGAQYPPLILRLNCVSGTDLPPTVGALECGRPFTPEKLACHASYYRRELLERTQCGAKLLLWLDMPVDSSLRAMPQAVHDCLLAEP